MLSVVLDKNFALNFLDEWIKITKFIGFQQVQQKNFEYFIKVSKILSHMTLIQDRVAQKVNFCVFLMVFTEMPRKFLKRTFLGLILCGESIARIIKV